MNFLLKKISLIIILFNFIFTTFGQHRKVDFYGVFSSDADKNMISMTEDLYYAQLGELPITLIDKRNDELKQEYLSGNSVNFSSPSPDVFIFYSVISKSEDSKWNCTISIKNIYENKIYNSSKEYDSYYKILMESKSSLNNIFTSLLNGGNGNESENENRVQQDSIMSSPPAISTQAIAGTWEGEQHIDKIVIMRGGRGFIIFKNGASMNITVSISSGEHSIIKISQASSSNASYFPELPRKTALEAAMDAKPIKWNLHLTGTGTLKGNKTTLIQDSDTENAVEGEVPVEWKRK